MKDDEIVQVKCNACEYAIIPELQEVHSGEFEMLFFVCPYCHKKYVVSVTDTELRRSIGCQWGRKRRKKLSCRK